MDYLHHRAPARLRHEIMDVCNIITPTQKDHEVRADVIKRVSSVVSSVWSQAEVKVYGSTATGLYLPTSDIDLVVLNCGTDGIQQRLRVLAAELGKSGIVRGTIQVVGKAIVPVVKFVDKSSGIAVDTSFYNQTGLQGIEFLKKALSDFPLLKPVYLVLKMFLHQNDLLGVNPNGGLSSYTLFVMLLVHLQTTAAAANLQDDAAAVLLGFFDFYGRRFDVRNDGISCRNGGSIFNKFARRLVDFRRPNSLVVEHPQEPRFNMAKPTSDFEKIREAFKKAHDLLTREPGDNEPVLSRILTVEGKLAKVNP